METARFLILACVFCAFVDAWEAIIPYDPWKNQTSYCFSDDHEIGEMNNGEEKRLETKCVQATCGANRYIILAGCGTVVVEPPCKVVDGDLSKPYPDCCHEIECPEGHKGV